MGTHDDEDGSISKVNLEDVFELDSDGGVNFSGGAELRRLLPNEPPVRVGRVAFDEGAQTRWHHHHGVQVLWFTDGEGEVSSRAGVTIACIAGDIVRVDPNVSHRHGASPGHTARHLAFTVGSTYWEEKDAPPGW